MKILLIGAKSFEKNLDEYYGHYLDFFKRAVKSSGEEHQLSHVLFEELIISVGDNTFEIYDTRNNCQLSDYDAVFIRGQFRQRIEEVRAISQYLKDNHIKSVNDYSDFRSSSKLIQAIQFHGAGLPVPKTVFLNSAVIENPEKVPMSMPCIMKDTYGSHGNNNVIVHSFEEVSKIAKDHPGVNFVLQRLVPNDHDYRILVAGKNHLIIKRSSTSDSHLNNTSQGGRAELVDDKDFPSEIVEQSMTVAKSLGMAVAGVDVLYDEQTGEHYFLEVNSQPQLMTGAFVEEKVKLIGEFLKDFSGSKPAA